MTISHEQLSAIERQAKAMLINETKNVETSLVDMLATTYQSDGADEIYVAVDASPQVRLLEDELQTENVGDATVTITNDTYAIGMEVRQSDLEDDRTSTLMDRMRGMIKVGLRHPNALIATTIQNATAINGYDGVPLLSAAHPDRGHGFGVQSNLLGGSGANDAGFRADLEIAMQTFPAFRQANGERMFGDGVTGVNLVLPWAMQAIADRVVRQQFGPAGESNVTFERFNIGITPNARLTDPNDVYALILDDGIRPIIYQQRMPLTFSLSAFDPRTEVAVAKVRYRAGVSVGDWRKIVKWVN